MRRAAITFVGLVAGIASCSSYGETKSENEAPSAVDGGSSGATIVDGGTDGLVANDSGDRDADAADPARHVPTIAQVTTGLMVSPTPDQLSLSFEQNVTQGNTVVLFIGTWGANVKLARIGEVVLDPIATQGQLPTQTALVKLVRDATTAGSRIDVQFDNTVSAPLAIAIELANAAGRDQNLSTGTGNVALEVAALPPALVIANVVGSGPSPSGPLNAQPLSQSGDSNGRAMASAWKLVIDPTTPKIRWTANDTFQWDAMVVAFKPGF